MDIEIYSFPFRQELFLLNYFEFELDLPQPFFFFLCLFNFEKLSFVTIDKKEKNSYFFIVVAVFFFFFCCPVDSFSLRLLFFQILEPRFTADTLAALLCIPAGKTLLRRHLATHFQSLIRSECHHVKEEAASQPAFQPLMPGSKHKVQYF